MKRILTTIIYIICLTVLVACSHNTTGIPASEKNTAQENDLKIAVVYFSATGTMKLSQIKSILKMTLIIITIIVELILK